MVEERAGRLLHLAVSTPYSSEPARPSSTRVQPRRPRGFSHKKYWSELLLSPWGSRAERVESTLTACPAFIFIIPLAPRVRRRRRRQRRRLCLPRVVGLPPFFSLAILWLLPAAALATPFLPHPPLYLLRNPSCVSGEKLFFMRLYVSNANESLLLLSYRII